MEIPAPRKYPDFWLFFSTQKLNSSPTDELRGGAYESGWWCQVKLEPQLGCEGTHGDP